nr:histone deacetylase 14 [Tanacetum cinerariifolium]
MANVNAPSDQTPTMAPPVRKKRATLIVIPSVRFTKLIIHHLQRMHKFHPRPDSPLYLSNEELVLGYLKFSAKGTKREIFGMPIPSRLITANIRAAPYYQEYQENVAKHRGFLAARKPQSTAQKAPTMPSISSSVTSTQLAPTSVAEEDADFQKAVEESMKDTYAHQWSSGNLSQENINLSQKCQERARLTCLRSSPADQYIFQRRVSEPTASSFLDVSLYEVLGQLDSEEESEKVVLGVKKSSQDE